MIGISSCLVGCKCTYKGSDNLVLKLQEYYQKNGAVLICPEVLGGLTIPRLPCEITGNKVKDIEGNDKTEAYQLGAKKALELLKESGVKAVVLKANSPSCGKGFVYDGTFTHRLIQGDGITTQLLKQHGIAVFNENELADFFKFIEKR
ncbi:DUF523 domain-containing protein [Thomasclavelia sp.]|uniref:DUF523 domain-containing protein n=1 Tax=Thomasclavelia sp. TaxID=3025757 RepID=UPI0025CDAAC9|nr:DUF523 domain-containing protein [Thomasclavelia sp.]